MANTSPKSSEGYVWTQTGSFSGLETKASIPSVSRLQDSYDIIIAGAGFAGLVAARDLSQHSRAKVLLVDARDRIGGRTWTAKVAGEELEMGGTWAHWNQPHVYSELHRYNLHRNLKSSAGTLNPLEQYYRAGDGQIRQVSIIKVNEICERVATRFFQVVDGLDSRSLMPYPHDPLRDPAPWKKFDHLSVRQRLDQITDLLQHERDMFESMVNSFGSAPGTEIGFTEVLRWYSLGGHSMAGTFESAGIFKIVNGGMTSLALAILDDFKGDLLLQTAVREITRHGSGVEVRTVGGKLIRAKAVISTIPLNCLGDVSFRPPLSLAHQEAIRHGHMNRGAKIHFKLAETHPGWFATCDGYSDSPYVFGFSDHNGNQSSGPEGTWCIGFGYGGQLTDKSDSAHIIDEFKRNVKQDADVLLYATHDWANDPYSKGTWSCWGPGAMSRHLADLQRSEGRVIFASADWADGWRGFVDGAIERGRKASKDAARFVEEGYMAKI